MRVRRLLFTTILPVLAVFSAQAADFKVPELQKTSLATPSLGKKEDVFIEADQMDYDSKTKIVTATGKVEILKGETVLFADNISYNQNDNTVTANGNVSIVGADGSAIFTDSFVLKDEFKNGVVEYFRARLNDGTLIAARAAKKTSDDRTVLLKAVYSPCPICATDPESDPQWQVKAEKVVVDNVKQQVEYTDATMEVYGVPVFYTPYFWHGTGNSPRESGFLMPSFRTDSNLGGAVTVPYYWNIAPNMDLTFEPVVTTKEGFVAAGEFRHLTEYGAYKFKGSFTKPSSGDAKEYDNDASDFRGHLAGEGRFDVSENWDFGFDGEVASDDTYLRRYNYGGGDLLTSRAYFERIKGRDYSNVQTVYFQGLLEQDDSDLTPFAMPYFRNHYETAKGIIPGFTGSKLWGELNGFAVSRRLGEDSRRASVSTGLNIPMVSDDGQILEFDASIRADQYDVDHVVTDNSPSRLLPEASVTWRLPMIDDSSKTGKFLFEPIAKLVVAPNKNYNRDIPNEDSQDVEFSDLNVFHNNRYRGIDRVESGTRVYYGLRGGYYEKDYDVSYLVGQNYRLKKPQSAVPVNSGIDDNFSDYVGRISANFYNTLDVSYKFRLDRDSFQPRRNEVDAKLDLDPVELSLTYFNLDYDFTSPTDNREEINGNVKVGVVDEWSVLFGGTRNLAENRNIDAEAGVLYEGDCTSVLTSVRRDFISDRDAKSGTSFNLKIGLKNLGSM